MPDLLRRTADVPDLRSPSLVIGLGGWTDAAEVSTGSVKYLRDKLRAHKFAELEGEEFFKYTSTRPKVAIEKGKVRSFTYPATEFFYWVNPDAPRDLVLLLGSEPDLKWPTYTRTVLDLAAELGVSRLCAVGGLYDSVSHTGDVQCSGTSPNQELLAELERMNVTPTSYFGPTGIITALMMAAQERGLPAASIWGRAPHYIQTANPKVWHQVLWRLTALCKVSVDIQPLMKRGFELTQQVNEALKENPQLREYVGQLEQAAPGDLPSGDRPASGEPLQSDDILRSVEEFFRQDDDPPSGR